eukprot:CAMPEP_0167805044 /NCGR_PEP_ID=MMETSP0111_2-20121227/20915_1 /TAXON_ID=91324 /ORGANISM="Lotharella globosa, Strain CCCM811" /LENGTH=38 /DNA_ID= /DNA_START= /DNA_END= /DNA_ORIENTATION=
MALAAPAAPASMDFCTGEDFLAVSTSGREDIFVSCCLS